ncbi:kinase-like domain-containing protein [Endogone sp. FLAS-F59071]|nr:kinase-like domain-containing protein [Endogone sp. FLAS-F59071]|eukprot:RUS23006.1 kinase-like domain-containing protein [Endogone sp. FLAS-F59071]
MSSMEETNLDRAKKQLLPFAQMDDYDQRDIKRLKDAFGQYDPILKDHLSRLNLSELSDRLAWIPFDLFQNVQKLAKGGFGTVYTAKLDYSLVYVGEDKTVALKVLNQSLLQEVVFSSQLSYIKHTVPVTTTVFGLSQNNSNELMMVMEYGTHGNMEQMSRASTWNRITDVAIELTRRLQVMHQYGVIHQDLHPGNIVFVKEFPRFIDVGLSKAVEDWKEIGGVYGRLNYHPPEVFQRKPYTKESDIYCLATLLWQSVTGVPPRGVAAMGEIREDGLREDLIPGAPTGFNDIFKRCWDPEPSKRPTAEELYELVMACRRKNKLFPQSRVQKYLSPETEAFIAECKANYQEEMSRSDSESFYFHSMCNSSQFSSHVELEKSVKLSRRLFRRRELNRTVEMNLGCGGWDDIKLPKDAESSLSVSSAMEKNGEESQPA